MPLWGRNDKAVTANSTTTVESTTGAPIGTYTLVKGDQVNRADGANAHFGNTSAGSRALVDVNMFGNTTIGAFIPGAAVGVFGVDAAEMGVSSGNLAFAYVTNAGSGYAANATVTLTVTNGGSSGVVNAAANATGKISQLNISTAGSGYITAPTIAIAAPTAQTFNANSAVTAGTGAGSNNIIALATAGAFVAGDQVTYTVAAGNTAIDGLTSGTTYFIQFANSTVVALATSSGGTRIALTKGATETGHTLQGITATGYVVAGGAKNEGVSHAGWTIRTEGSGGRAGRVQYETLVAMGSLGAQTAAFGTPATTADASDDTLLPDS
jgi:hypothetical protein